MGGGVGETGTTKKTRNDSKELSKFMRDTLRTIELDRNHRLQELTEPVLGKNGKPERYKKKPLRGVAKRRWKTASAADTGRTKAGRYHGSNQNWVVQAGHLTTHKGSPNNYLALEWADANMVKPHAEKLGVVFNAVGVDIDGVLVEYSTAEMLAQDPNFKGFTQDDLKRAKKVTTPMYQELVRKHGGTSKKRRRRAGRSQRRKRQRQRRAKKKRDATIEAARKKPKKRVDRTPPANAPDPASLGNKGTKDKGLAHRTKPKPRTKSKLRSRVKTAVKGAAAGGAVELTLWGMAFLKARAIAMFRRQKREVIRKLRLEGNWVALFVLIEVPDKVDVLAFADPVDHTTVVDVAVYHGGSRESAMTPPREARMYSSRDRGRGGKRPRDDHHFETQPLEVYPPLRDPDDAKLVGTYEMIHADAWAKKAKQLTFSRELWILGGTVSSNQPQFFSTKSKQQLRPLAQGREAMIGRIGAKPTTFAIQGKAIVMYGFMQTLTRPFYVIISRLESFELQESGLIVFKERFVSGSASSWRTLNKYIGKRPRDLPTGVTGGEILWAKKGIDWSKKLSGSAE